LRDDREWERDRQQRERERESTERKRKRERESGRDSNPVKSHQMVPKNLHHPKENHIYYTRSARKMGFRFFFIEIRGLK